MGNIFYKRNFFPHCHPQFFSFFVNVTIEVPTTTSWHISFDWGPRRLVVHCVWGSLSTVSYKVLLLPPFFSFFVFVILKNYLLIPVCISSPQTSSLFFIFEWFFFFFFCARETKVQNRAMIARTKKKIWWKRKEKDTTFLFEVRTQNTERFIPDVFCVFFFLPSGLLSLSSETYGQKKISEFSLLTTQATTTKKKMSQH